MDIIGTSDPYVILELFPSTLNPKKPKKDSLPPAILNTPGAVLHLSVWDKDMLKDEFIGECFIPLMSIESLKNRASIRDIPVSEVRLRKQNKHAQPKIYQLIQSRAKVDREAAEFVQKRSCTMKSGDDNDGQGTLS
ncbi:unnamed protein product [Rotaria sp. Silwood1]|nr:unnamed protein product [Rotaria sp. Silwood1]CAF1610388.1 unnamed protein product [Rotaria sp. Silwood1]CAF3700416.1 unnamed protein product [Rotaria sp. Silwood1]CAF3707962.1 unnamed protein product [Rotaria sp. Silwood1]CAF4864546.1 unnamed protein product [Rotaria sp. Silwood1]